MLLGGGEAVSNPTREKVQGWIDRGDWGGEGMDPLIDNACWLALSYLRALDTRDELQSILEDGYRPEGVSEDGYPYWVANRVAEAAKKFDGGDDNSEEDPMLTEGQRRRRQEAQRCSHGIPRKECGSDE